VRKQLTPYDFHGYQNEAIKHGLHHPQAMYWLDVGLGKTTIAQTIILERIETMYSMGVLVFAPKRVCRMVWRQEPQHWAHLDRKLRFSLVDGTRKQREYALRKPADVHLVNYEFAVQAVDIIIDVWLSRGEYPPWTTIIYDEVDKLKDPTSQRATALRDILGFFPYRIGMTGTPASEGYRDLFGQYLMVDGGARLGTSETEYLSTYFRKAGYKYELLPGADDQIKALIGDITFQHSQRFAEKPLVNDIWVELPPKARAQYDKLEKEMFMEIEGGGAIEVFNEASKVNKCLQAAAGHPYLATDTKEWYKLHDEKLNALQDIVDESNGQPILVGYQFTSDRDRILEKFPRAVYLGGNLTEREERRIQDDWDSGKIQMLVGHPASMGHGLNLQYGGHIAVWFGLNWSRRLYIQLTGRLDRQGQESLVILHRILARNTVDLVQLMALDAKEGIEVDLKETINQYRTGAFG